jgi:TPR repeat protein
VSGGDWFALAKAGDLDALLELAYADVDGDETEEADAQAYKWLVVALDFGHAKAENLIDDLYEGTSLRFDDDQFVAGETHLELGVAYLLGADGFAKDLAKGREHLVEADECGFPASIQGGEEMLAEIRAKLPSDSLAVFDEIYPRSS